MVLHLKYLSQFVTVRLNRINIQYKYSRKTHLGFKHEIERERERDDRLSAELSR